MSSESLEILKKNIDISTDTDTSVKAMLIAVNAVMNVTLGLDTRLKEHDSMLKKRVYLSMIHCRLLTKEVRERVSELCTLHKFSYKDHARYVFSCLYNMLYEAYGVNSYRELPDIYFDDILERIRTWNNADKIRDKIGS